VRRLTTLSLAIALVAASCTTGAGTTGQGATPGESSAPSPMPTDAASGAGGVGATSTPSPTLTSVSARITFEDSTCAYTGPTVIPFPATLTVEYAPSQALKDSFLGIFAVRSGTTEADLQDPDLPDIGEGTPPFVYLDTHMFAQGVSTGPYRAVDTGANPMAELGPDGRPYDTFVVLCVPEIPGRPVGAQTILHLVDTRASPAATPAP
jgi:hypothetical protein